MIILLTNNKPTLFLEATNYLIQNKTIAQKLSQAGKERLSLYKWDVNMGKIQNMLLRDII